MKNKVIIKLIAAIGVIAASLGLVLAILPMGTVAFLPAGIGLLLGLLCCFLARGLEIKKLLYRIVIILSFLGILIAGGKALFVKNEVAYDVEFLNKETESEVESIDELNSEEMQEELGDIE